jgi:hypothetical protein
MHEKFLCPVFSLGLRSRVSNSPPHPVGNVIWKPLVELAEAVRDDEPIVADEVTVLNGICVVARSGLFDGRFFQKDWAFLGIDHLRNLQVPAKS